MLGILAIHTLVYLLWWLGFEPKKYEIYLLKFVARCLTVYKSLSCIIFRKRKKSMTIPVISGALLFITFMYMIIGSLHSDLLSVSEWTVVHVTFESYRLCKQVAKIGV